MLLEARVSQPPGTHVFLSEFRVMDGVEVITNPSVFRVRSNGDIADLYRRITGKEHPTLKGELNEGYTAFLKRRR